MQAFVGNACWKLDNFFLAFKYSFNSFIEAGIIQTSGHSVEELSG